MKVRFPYQVAICAWIDLLGYGESIARAGFNPLRKESKDAVGRLRRFHRIVAEHSLRRFPTLVMNDGAAAYRDLSWRTRWPTFEFISDAFKLHQAVNHAELKDGLPGARMVIGTGFRLRGRRGGKDARQDYFSKIIRDFKNGELTLEEAIGKAGGYRDSFDIVPALQANFAFTKAYVADQSGKAKGLEGPKCFLDLSVFHQPLPDWLQIGPEINWVFERLSMSCVFAELLDLPESKECRNTSGTVLDGGPLGVRDAIEVGEHITRDATILAQMRAAYNSGV